MRSVGRRMLFAGVACALGLAGGGGYFLMSGGYLGMDLSSLNGVWRSQGYGWLWVIQDGRLRAYDEGAGYCVERTKAEALDGLRRGYKLSEDGRLLRLSLADPAYRFTFDRIDAVPPACARMPDASPPAVIDALDAIFSAHYAFFPARKVDWPAVVGDAKKQVTSVTSQPELLEVVRALLANFDDDHVSLQAQVNGRKVVCNTGEGQALRGVAHQARQNGVELNDMIERWKRTVWTKAAEEDLLGSTARTTANGAIKYGLIGDDIGFLSILSMEDFDPSDADDAAVLDEALDQAMAAFSDVKAVIVDVSVNDGGEDALARAIAARFAETRTRAYSKYAGDAREPAPQDIYIEPDELRYTGPVYLLTSNVTVSAAEVFTMAMRALPNVTHVGQTTRGALSDVLTKKLPNGWRVTLSNEIYRDSAGNAWEGRGVPPTIPIEVFNGKDSDAAKTHLQAVRSVVDLIRLGS